MYARGVIYAVVNKVDGKKYVGQTTMDSLQRFQKHLRSARTGNKGLLHAAIREYGESNFELRVLHLSVGKISLDVLEERFISELNTRHPYGYNRQTGGKRGFTQSLETRSQLREAAIAQFSAPGAREAVAERTRQQFADPEKRARHRAAYERPETKAKISAQNVGKRWITDGTESRVLWPGEEMPEGWRYGASFTTVGASRCRWINDGATCRMIPRDKMTPDGWVNGKIDVKPNKRNAGKRWITNGERNDMVSTGDSLPEGWRYGMTRPPSRFSSPGGIFTARRTEK